MLGEIVPVVAAGIEMKFVRNSLGGEQVREMPARRRRSRIDLRCRSRNRFSCPWGARRFDQRERIVAVPECAIEGRAERRAHRAAERLLPADSEACTAGSLAISAALCALTEPKSCG